MNTKGFSVKKVRHSVFETNSSSSHSLTLVKSDLSTIGLSKDVLRKGVVDVGVSEYGWEWFRYYTPTNKLSYLLTQITDGDLDGRDTATLIEDFPMIHRMARVLKEHTGCELHIFNSSGYVDHDSVGVGMAVLSSDESLREFLFSESSYVETSNDNSSAPWTISTDKSQEFYYSPFYTDIPSDYVLVGAFSTDTYSFNSIFLKTGGYIDEFTNKTLFDEIQKYAILVNATLLPPTINRVGYNRLDDTDPRVYCISNMRGLFKEGQLRVFENFDACVIDDPHGMGIVNFHTDHLILANLAMPRVLADKLSALPVDGALNIQLEDFKDAKKSAEVALKKDPTHHFYKERLKNAIPAIEYFKNKLKELKKGVANAS
jgi:hypothetical protein